MPPSYLYLRRLSRRPIGVPIQFVRATATLPTLTMFHVFWNITDRRARGAWRSPTWATYFRREYLYEQRLVPPASEQYGIETLLRGRWHYGLGSGCVQGHGASQQAPEAGHAHFKGAVEGARNILEVLRKHEEAVSLWTSPTHGEEKGFSRLAATGDIAITPTRPDAWMLGRG